MGPVDYVDGGDAATSLDSRWYLDGFDETGDSANSGNLHIQSRNLSWLESLSCEPVAQLLEVRCSDDSVLGSGVDQAKAWSDRESSEVCDSKLVVGDWLRIGPS